MPKGFPCQPIYFWSNLFPLKLHAVTLPENTMSKMMPGQQCLDMPRPSEHQDCENKSKNIKINHPQSPTMWGSFSVTPSGILYTQYLLFVSFASLFKIGNPAPLPWHAMTYETAVPIASTFDQIATNGSDCATVCCIHLRYVILDILPYIYTYVYTICYLNLW